MGYATEEQAERIFKAIEEDKARSIEQMPDIDAALWVFHRAYRRLIELGFRDIIYHPKDGREFEVIEPGSTGIHRCQYWETPTRGSFWIDGDSPSHPVLFREYTAAGKEAAP